MCACTAKTKTLLAMAILSYAAAAASSSSKQDESLLDIRFSLFCLGLTWHADAAVAAPLVDAGALVLARVGLALVHVDLAAGAGEPGGAVAAVGAGGVHADTVVLTGRS